MRSLVAIVASLGACGGHATRTTSDAPTGEADGPLYDCAAETRADTFAIGLDKVGMGGVLDFKLTSADPAPPARGDNTWTIQLSAMMGVGVAGASLTATPFMPDHQHGSPIEVAITDKGGGAYELSPVNLWMPGLWQTTIQATSATGTDSAVFAFCLPN